MTMEHLVNGTQSDASTERVDLRQAVEEFDSKIFTGLNQLITERAVGYATARLQAAQAKAQGRAQDVQRYTGQSDLLRDMLLNHGDAIDSIGTAMCTIRSALSKLLASEKDLQVQYDPSSSSD